jgi:hypothetical protein
MAEPTVTRSDLRHELCRRLGMEFFQRVGTSGTSTATGSITTLVDTTRLKQANDVWNGSYLYLTSTGSVRLINDFVSTSGTVSWLPALGSASGNGTTYEIHTNFTADQIHDAINSAIEDGFPEFFEVTTDETTALTQDTLEYTLPGTPYFVLSMWLESVNEKDKGTVSSHQSTTTLTDNTKSWTTNAFDNMQVAIYDGTGKGQNRVISGNSATQLTVPTWTTNPNSTSKYVIKDITEEVADWHRIVAARFDQTFYPATTYLTSRYSAHAGHSLRVVYVAKPARLTADSGTTVIPREYIIRKALAYLHASRIGDSRADSDRHRYLQQMYESMAEIYKLQNKFRLPKSTMWIEQETVVDTPLEYPF